MIRRIRGVMRLLATPEDLLDSRGELNLTIPGCPLLMAPVLLYILKRRGFSRCRAWRDRAGITLAASR